MSDPVQTVDAVCVGESMVLLVPDPPGPLPAATSLRVEVAGAESNVATYLAMLGLRSAWVSRIGADPLGRIVRDRIGSYDVDTALVATDPHGRPVCSSKTRMRAGPLSTTCGPGRRRRGWTSRCGPKWLRWVPVWFI